MRSLRSWPFVVVLLAAACSATPLAVDLAGEYDGQAGPRATGQPQSTWIPARLELFADGSCLWRPAHETTDAVGVFTPLGDWNVDATGPGHEVLVVHPDRRHPDRRLTFDVTASDGQIVLIAADGSRLTRDRHANGV